MNKTTYLNEDVTNNYTKIPNELLHDTRLSINARFLYMEIISKPKTFIINVTKMAKDLGLPRKATTKAIKELCSLDLLSQKRIGKYWEYTVKNYRNNNNQMGQIGPIKSDTSNTHYGSNQMGQIGCIIKTEYINTQLINNNNIYIYKFNNIYTEVKNLNRKEYNIPKIYILISKLKDVISKSRDNNKFKYTKEEYLQFKEIIDNEKIKTDNDDNIYINKTNNIAFANASDIDLTDDEVYEPNVKRLQVYIKQPHLHPYIFKTKDDVEYILNNPDIFNNIDNYDIFKEKAINNS